MEDAMQTKLGMRLSYGLSFIGLLLCLTVTGYAQDNHRLSLNAGAGVSPLVGGISDRLENGWNATAGAGFRFTSRFETNLQFTYNGYGVRPAVLNELGVPGGNSHLWSLTVDPKIKLGRGDRVFDPYVVGGVGYYRRTVEFTAPTVAQVFLFDPFFDTFFTQLVPANQVLGSITRGGVGGSGGVGFDVMVGHTGVRFFTEARYHYADTGRIATRMVPVTFGFKW